MVIVRLTTQPRTSAEPYSARGAREKCIALRTHTTQAQGCGRSFKRRGALRIGERGEGGTVLNHNMSVRNAHVYSEIARERTLIDFSDPKVTLSRFGRLKIRCPDLEHFCSFAVKFERLDQKSILAHFLARKTSLHHIHSGEVDPPDSLKSPRGNGRLSSNMLYFRALLAFKEEFFWGVGRTDIGTVLRVSSLRAQSLLAKK